MLVVGFVRRAVLLRDADLLIGHPGEELRCRLKENVVFVAANSLRGDCLSRPPGLGEM